MAERTECSKCNRKVHGRGLCSTHYCQQWRAAQPPRERQPRERKEPNERCSVCGDVLRPYGSTLDDWPGTKAKVSTNPLLCTAHQYGKGAATQDFSGHDIVKPKPEEVRMVRRLIRDRLEGDDYLLVVDALGIGADID